MGRWPLAMDIVFHRKKQNSNRGNVVGMVSILAKEKCGPYKDRLLYWVNKFVFAVKE
jgi:hypothetical protein